MSADIIHCSRTYDKRSYHTRRLPFHMHFISQVSLPFHLYNAEHQQAISLRLILGVFLTQSLHSVRHRSSSLHTEMKQDGPQKVMYTYSDGSSLALLRDKTSPVISQKKQNSLRKPCPSAYFGVQHCRICWDG